MMDTGNYMIILSPEQLEEWKLKMSNLEKSIANIRIHSNEVEQPMTEIEAVKWLQVSRTTLQSWRREGKIPFQVLGGRIYYLRSELLAAMTKINSNG